MVWGVNMLIFIFILSLYISIKTFFYALYEIKEKNNTAGGIFIVLLSIVSLIAPTVLASIR